MAHPAASSSQPAQIPSLVDIPQDAAADKKAPKEKKGQGKATNTSSEFPLEVCFFDF